MPRQDCLGPYGEQFGAPEFSARLAGDLIAELEVIRGAPCGATWEAASRVIGLKASRALEEIGLQTQFYCVADPSAWDPLWGKSPVHLAADVHKAALQRAVKRLKNRGHLC